MQVDYIQDVPETSSTERMHVLSTECWCSPLIELIDGEYLRHRTGQERNALTAVEVRAIVREEFQTCMSEAAAAIAGPMVDLTSILSGSSASASTACSALAQFLGGDAS
jgi:hypothetical protein